MSQQFNYELVIRANEAQAVAALQAFKAAGEDAGREVETSLRGTASAATALGGPLAQARVATDGVRQASAAAAIATTGQARSFEELRRALDPAYANAQRYRAVQAEVAAMVESGEASQRGANIVLEQAARQYMGVATAAERKAAAEREAQLTTMLATQGYQALRASVDPAFASAQRMEQAIRVLDAAQDQGVISDRERLQTLALLEAQMQSLAGAATRASQASAMATTRAAVAAGNGSASAHTANLGFQANDIIMMSALGQSPYMLTLQQGPQVVQIFNQMRASGQAIGPAIASSITSLINPMAALTLGVIAGTAALIQWGVAAFDAGDEAMTLEERIDNLKQAMDAYRAATDQAGATSRDLISEYGAGAAEAREFLDIQRQLAAAEAQRQLTISTNAAAGAFGRNILGSDAASIATLEALRETNRIQVELQNRAAFEGITALEQTVLEGMQAVNAAQEQFFLGNRAILDDIDLLRERLDITHNDAVSLAMAMADLGNADGPAAQADAARDLARQIFDATDGLRSADDETNKLYQSLLTVVVEGLKFAAMDMSSGVEAGASAAARFESALAAARSQLEGIVGLLASIGGGVLDRASMQAQMAILRAGGTAADARLAAERQRQDAELAGRRMELERTFGSTVGGAMGAAIQWEADGRRAMEDELAALIASAPTAGSQNSGGGSGSSSQSNPVRDLIASLNDELALLRELDPVQQELLRHREVLAEATAEERQTVEGLIRTRIAEVEALERVQERLDTVRDLGRDAVSGLFDGVRAGDDAADIFDAMLDRMEDRLAEFASNQILDGLFGARGAPATGLVGWLSGLIFPGSGSSGPTGAAGARPFGLGDVFDSPQFFMMGGGRLGVMAEAGPEAIMPLSHGFGQGVGALIDGVETTLPLARLASGKLGVDLGGASPFAMGGAFGDLPAMSAPASWRAAMTGGLSNAQATSPVIQIAPTIVNNTGRPMEMEVEEYTDTRGQRQQRYVLSEATAAGLSTPGGQAGRALKRGYGLNPLTRRRD